MPSVDIRNVCCLVSRTGRGEEDYEDFCGFDDDDDGDDDDDDIYIMMKCMCVTKNHHFLLGVSCNHPGWFFMVLGRFLWFFMVLGQVL